MLGGVPPKIHYPPPKNIKAPPLPMHGDTWRHLVTRGDTLATPGDTLATPWRHLATRGDAPQLRGDARLCAVTRGGCAVTRRHFPRVW